MISIQGQLVEKYLTPDEKQKIKTEPPDPEDEAKPITIACDPVLIKREDDWNDSLYASEETMGQFHAQASTNSGILDTSEEGPGFKIKTENTASMLQENFTCNFCQQQVPLTNKASHLWLHNRMKNAESTESAESATCQLCNVTFKRPRNCAIHLANFHGILKTTWARKEYPGWSHVCHHCKYHFRWKELIWYHKCDRSEQANDHLSEGSFEQNKFVVEHHSKYECEKCKSTFKVKQIFETHIETCNQEAKHKNEIKMRKKKVIVTDQDKHIKEGVQCPDCGQKFANNSKLERHNNAIHLQIKPFACEQCPKKYREKRALENHFASKHLGTPRFECEFCGEKFMSYHGCLYHRKKKHAADLETRNGGRTPVKELFSMDGCKIVEADLGNMEH
ncbi:gastrula zinc finger protein XlCGF46.1-like [Uranotaenia lowii]|uniref:gastrula zinc finger protein XlCGF46.1-like n=1 Tax=Uranotaenia lowii TaxID=190385 RepID=UPI002479C666|nr:gastrula zinc finger protein XlCGF46.1-like [Uranotaenia lowii]